MKKIMSGLVIMSILLVGCSNEKVDKKEEKQVQKEKPKEEKKEVVKEAGLNHEELMQNNRNSIVGEYVNYNGEVITINADGTLNYNNGLDSSNQIVSEVQYLENGSYQWDLNLKDSPVGGAYVKVYPQGIDILGMTGPNEEGKYEEAVLSTNKEAVRLITRNGIPTEKDVYTKK